MGKLLPSILVFVLFGSFAKQNPPARIFVPANWCQKIQRHLVQIESRGFGKTVPGDLYHAHILLSAGTKESFGSIDELFENSPLILYHSDEMLERWLGKEGDLAPQKKTPRSIVGYWDGRIADAATLAANPLKFADYKYFGTIHPDALAADHPSQLAMWRRRRIETEGGDCLVNLIVDISIVYADQSHANLELGNRKYELTMDCAK